MPDSPRISDLGEGVFVALDDEETGLVLRSIEGVAIYVSYLTWGRLKEWARISLESTNARAPRGQR